MWADFLMCFLHSCINYVCVCKCNSVCACVRERTRVCVYLCVCLLWKCSNFTICVCSVIYVYYVWVHALFVNVYRRGQKLSHALLWPERYRGISKCCYEYDMWGMKSFLLSNFHLPVTEDNSPEDGVHLPTLRGNWKQMHTQSSHPNPGDPGSVKPWFEKNNM